MQTRILLSMLLAGLVVILAARALAPSDLYERDQVLTVTYTADMLAHQNYALPHDAEGGPATKPPMFNWIGAAALRAIGEPYDWVLRLPSVFAGLCSILVITMMGAYLARPRMPAVGAEPGLTGSEEPSDATPIAIGLLAALIWLANHLTVRIIYEARPNGVLNAFLLAGWALATVLLCSPPARSPGKPTRSVGRVAMQVGLWLCVAGAALSKGPPALLLVIYILLGAWLFRGHLRIALRTGIAWGLPAALLIVAGWLGLVYQQDPDHLQQTLIGREVIGRAAGHGDSGSFIQQLLTFWKAPGYFLSRFLPWSVIVVVALAAIRPRQWFSHRMAPAIVWMLVVIGFFALLGNKKATYIYPALAPGAILAGWYLLRGSVKRLRPATAGAAALAVAVALAAIHYLSPRFGDHEQSAEVRQQVRAILESGQGDDDALDDGQFDDYELYDHADGDDDEDDDEDDTESA